VQHDFRCLSTRAGWLGASGVGIPVLSRVGAAGGGAQADLIVLPETAITGYINEEFLNATPTELDEIRRRRYPPNYPLAELNSYQRFSKQVLESFQRCAI